MDYAFRIRKLWFNPRVHSDDRENLQKHRVTVLSSASCWEKYVSCLKVNTINSSYFSSAALLFVLSPNLRFPSFLTSLLLSIHCSGLPPKLLVPSLLPVFLFLPASLLLSLIWSQSGNVIIHWFLSGRLYVCPLTATYSDLCVLI